MLKIKINKNLKEFSLNVDLSFSKKSLIIRGPSGSGKTTLLRCIAGLENVSKGHISLGETVYLDTLRKIWVPPAQRGIGFAFQDYLLFPHLNVKDNILYSLRSQGNGRSKLKSNSLDEVINGLEIPGSYLLRYPRELSGGEKQRVSLARALIAGHRLFLLDEPFNAVDKKCCCHLIDFISEWIKKQDAMVIIVSHDETDLLSLKNSYLNLENGRVLSFCGEGCA
ncbi:MAG: ATP-binding cassette domain-containing protein [Bacillota bacterium]